MVVHKYIEGKLRELLGHYAEIDREALKIGAQEGRPGVQPSQGALLRQAAPPPPPPPGSSLYALLARSCPCLTP
eukprot:COSAG01_NODE_4468_length_4998_cov_52.401715_4_plen_74_part_00